MGRSLYISQKKALMSWVDGVARKSGWDGDKAISPMTWPGSADEIPADTYLRVEAMNPWETFYSAAARFCEDYAAWAYGGELLWQWRRKHGNDGVSMHGPVTSAEADEWMRSARH